MKMSVLFILVFSVCVFSLNGCATMTRTGEPSTQELRNQVITLQEQLQQKDAEIESLRKELSDMQERKQSSARSVTTKPNVRQIQVALTNAGFDPGPVDGKMGRKTKNAVKEFQSANGLVVDGKVGKNTWSLLSEYSEK